MGRKAAYGLYAYDAFALRLVREHWRTGDVAYRINAQDIGPAASVDRDAAPFHPDAQVLEFQVLDIPLNACGDDERVAGDLRRAAAVDRCDQPSVRRASQGPNPGAGVDRNPPPLELRAGEFRNFLILRSPASSTMRGRRGASRWWESTSATRSPSTSARSR